METGKSVEEVKDEEAGRSVEAEKVPKIKKRKRDDVTCTQETPIPTVQKRKKESKPLNGLILAVSTLDVKNEKHSSADSSYQAVAALCTELGAKVRERFVIGIYTIHIIFIFKKIVSCILICW
jgi:hypothetical protein